MKRLLFCARASNLYRVKIMTTRKMGGHDFMLNTAHIQIGFAVGYVQLAGAAAGLLHKLLRLSLRVCAPSFAGFAE